MMKNYKTALCPCLYHSAASEENNPQQCEVNQVFFFTVTCLHMLKSLQVMNILILRKGQINND